MSTETTSRMLGAYVQEQVPTLYLSGMFESPQQNFYSGESVEIDIVRSDEDIAIVIQDLSTGHRMNSTDLYTNKQFTPPIYKEAVAINSFDLLKRMPGNDPFQDPDYRADVMTRLTSGMVKVQRKIRRSIELQASQILQTGILTLTDETGAALYTLDYKPKASHFPTSGTAWGTAGADPLGDILALANVIRNDGLSDPDELHFGENAYQTFIQDDTVQKHLNGRRIDQGSVVPMTPRGAGGNHRGFIDIGNYTYQIFTYGGRYKDPQTGAKIPYLDTGKVIVRASSGRMDATFGAIPNIGRLLGAGDQLLPELPGRISDTAGGVDLFTNAWITPDGEQLFGGVGTRPLLIPTAIDTYGCLTTGA